jgi:peptidoglycan biosynthesis protein MviN/MurJ (putative lipid II flippase)
MDDFTIELKYNLEHFKEIYYQNGQGAIMTNDDTKTAVLITIFFILVTIVFYCVGLKFESLSWLVVLGVISIAGSIVYASITLYAYWKWKNQIKRFLKKLGEYKFQMLSVTSNAIEIILDKESTIGRWDEIKATVLTPQYIVLKSAHGFLSMFPAKSMRVDEFDRLTEFVKNKVK